MKTAVLLILTLLSVQLIAQENTHREYYDDGMLKAEYVHTGTLVQVALYHTNGKLHEKGAYWGGQPHGRWHQYAETGKLLVTGKFNRGQRTGKWLFQTDQGIVTMDLRFKKSIFINGEQYTKQGELIAKQ